MIKTTPAAEWIIGKDGMRLGGFISYTVDESSDNLRQAAAGMFGVPVQWTEFVTMEVGGLSVFTVEVSTTIGEIVRVVLLPVL